MLLIEDGWACDYELLVGILCGCLVRDVVS